MRPPHAPVDKFPGRHCWICGRVGGSGSTTNLRMLDYDIPKGAIGYAHGDCINAERGRHKKRIARITSKS